MSNQRRRDDEQNTIHGVNYYTSGRYNYTAIDCTHKNTSGCETLITGLKPKKLAVEIHNAIESVQFDSLQALLVAQWLGESANSHELYLYAVNTRKIHDDHFVPIRAEAIALFEQKEPAVSRLNSLVALIYWAFKKGAELYIKEIKPEGFLNFTGLDFAVCTWQYLNYLRSEYSANGLK